MWSPALAGLRLPPAVAAGTLLLDLITATVVGAYGTRKLRTAYAGSCIRVRRSSDNAEQDIGFVSAAMDTSALTTFCGSGDGFVSKFYGQSTAGQDLAQTVAANQPQIVSSGVVVNLGNATARPALLFPVADQRALFHSTFAMGVASFACAGVGLTEDTSGFRRFIAFTGSAASNDYDNTASVLISASSSGFIRSYRNGSEKSNTAHNTVPFEHQSIWDGANHTMLVNGTAGSSVTSTGTLASSGRLFLGGTFNGVGSDFWGGRIAEVLVVSGTLSSADQATIRTSQKTHYGTP